MLNKKIFINFIILFDKKAICEYGNFYTDTDSLLFPRHYLKDATALGSLLTLFIEKNYSNFDMIIK